MRHIGRSNSTQVWRFFLRMLCVLGTWLLLLGCGANPEDLGGGGAGVAPSGLRTALWKAQQAETSPAYWAVEVDSLMGVQQQKLLASDGIANDNFGFSVALSGDTAIVGAPDDDVGANSNQGSAYILVRSGVVWTQQAKLTASDGAASDKFGISVALSGDTALVGAFVDDVGANTDQGSAYVFVRSGVVWTQQAKLTASDGAASDQFGISIALDGDTALVGARLDDIGANNGQGSAYVFVRSGIVWTQQAKLTASDGAASDYFGESVALSGDTALVGAPEHDVVNFNQGSAYVFVKPAMGGWAMTANYEAKLLTSDGAAGDKFGESVALDGDTALVGASSVDGTFSDQGAAYIFVKPGAVWGDPQSPPVIDQTAKLTPSNPTVNFSLGYRVALSGDTALVSHNPNVGGAFVFVKPAGGWTDTTTFDAQLNPTGGTTAKRYGESVALDGDTALVGASADDNGANMDQGSAYVFVLLKANGDACVVGTNCQSGFCVDGVCCNSACPATCQACSAAKNGSANGTCSSIPLNTDPDSECSTECNGSSACEAADGAACTLVSQCQSGFCVDSACCQVAGCTALDQCHIVGTCQAGTGTCSNPAKADGSSCNDADACTQTDTCQSGACNGANPVGCTALDQCHIVGTCQAGTGTCSNPAKADGSSCNDADACTQTDSCQAGACTGANPVVCTALDQCHDVGNCNPAMGMCSNPAKADGSSCNDADACTQTDSCQAGACTGANPVVCTALDQCHDVGTCNALTGMCSNPAKTDGSSCNDADACTQTDSCQAGACTGANPVVCTALDQCHDVGNCNPAMGMCSNPAKADGSSCIGASDENLGTCQAGLCHSNVKPLRPCTTQDECPDFFECISSKCQPVTKGPLDSISGCACSFPADASSRPAASMLALALTAFFVRRRRVSHKL